jgi:hypothetical protein
MFFKYSNAKPIWMDLSDEYSPLTMSWPEIDELIKTPRCNAAAGIGFLWWGTLFGFIDITIKPLQIGVG